MVMLILFVSFRQFENAGKQKIFLGNWGRAGGCKNFFGVGANDELMLWRAKNAGVSQWHLKPPKPVVNFISLYVLCAGNGHSFMCGREVNRYNSLLHCCSQRRQLKKENLGPFRHTKWLQMAWKLSQEQVLGTNLHSKVYRSGTAAVRFGPSEVT